MLTKLKHCIQYARFSVDKTKSKFNFKPIHDDPVAPASAQSQQKQTNVGGKLFKLQRKQKPLGLETAQPQYKDNQQHISKAEQAYREDIDKRVAENKATEKFYEYEINRGEDLIDEIPVNPYYEYKMNDLKLEIEHRKKVIQQFQGVQHLIDSSRLGKLKALVAGYQSMKHRYEMDQFLKNIEKYPGSIKGSKPEDDPQSYGEYVNKIMPEWVRAELTMNNQLKMATQEVDIHGDTIEPIGTHVSDYLSNEPKIDVSQDDLEKLRDKALEDLSNSPMLQDYDPVPALPYTNFEEYHTFIGKMRAWAKFRAHYDRVNNNKKLKRINDMLDDIGKQQYKLTISEQQKKKMSKKNKRRFKDKQWSLKPSVYSLYTYYKTLPKEFQEHPGVRAAYLGLEYCSPDIPYEEKEDLLNEAAKKSLPLDAFSMAAMEKLTEKDRQYLTPHLADRLYNISPEFTWDMRQFLEEVKNEKLRSISTVKEKEESFIQPPQKYKDMEVGANLPVDFYDNDDGFWTHHIDKKLKKYEKVQPLSKKPKKHLQH